MYYINPWVFYIVSLISNIQIAAIWLIVGLVTFAVIGVPCGGLIIEAITPTKEAEDAANAALCKWIKRLPIMFIVCISLAVVIPSESTMYKMMIASKISTDDVDHVIERLDDVVDSIIESKEQADGSAD